MSAHMVSDETITALVDVAVLGPADIPIPYEGYCFPATQADDLAQSLIAVNVASLRERYPDAWPQMIRDPETSYEWPGLAPGRPRPDVVQALKLIAYWRYQSCEYEAWEAMQGAGSMRTLEQHLIRSLPGWEAAPWGWERA